MRKGWGKVTLKNISNINYGYTESASVQEVGPKFLRITDICDAGVNWDAVPYCEINDFQYSKFKLYDGDIVFARTGATTGKSYLVANPPDSVFASYLIRLRLDKQEILPEFVNYYFQSGEYWNEIRQGVAGSAQGGFNATKLGELVVPVPPLPEQRRIVGILDKAFAAIASAKANAEKNEAEHDKLKQAFLYQIFTVTNPVGEKWGKVKLKSISNINYGFTESASVQEVGPKFLRITDICDTGVNWDTVPYCKIDDSKYSKFKLHDGDIVFARTGATTGKSYLVADPPDSVFASYLIRVQLKKHEMLPNFLYYFFQSDDYWETIQNGVTGSAQGGFNASKLGELTIPIPSHSEQCRIAGILDKVFAAIATSRVNYHRKIHYLNELKQSLLHQAFTGDL